MVSHSLTFATMTVSLFAIVLAGCLPEGTFSGGERRHYWNEMSAAGPPRFTPQWTPDGEQILFIFGHHGGKMYTAASGGTSLRLLNSDDLMVKRADAEDVFLNSPDVSSDGSRIAYMTTIPTKGWRHDDWEIETSKPDGSGRVRLTENGIQDTSPVWSPDGTRIAFTHMGPGSRENDPYPDVILYSMAADGSDMRVLLRAFDLPLADSYFGPASRHALEWSPDGTMLAMGLEGKVPDPKRTPSRPELPAHFLYTIGADGSGLTELFTVMDNRKNVIYSGPAWSPDGTRIAFITQSVTTWEATLYTVGPDGSDLQELDRRLPPGEFGRHPSLEWSPDGMRILISWGYIFERWGGQHTRKTPIQVINADGTGLRTVAEGTHASWSPDGTRIATVDMYRDVEGAPFLSTVAADGSDVRVLVRRTENGDGLQAEHRSCFLWFCR